MFTKEQIALATGERCPYCASTDVGRGNEIPEFGMIHEHRRCESCYKSFWLVYAATDARED